MSIFNKDHNNLFKDHKTEFEKIGVHVVVPYKKKDAWFFKYNNKDYPLAPSPIVAGSLSPIIIGADNFIKVGCEAKGINNPEKGFNLLFSSEYFPTCDVKLKLQDYFFDGYIYLVEPVNYANVMPGQSVFMCSFINLYYKTPPKELFLKAESK